ncbi:Uncharacterised protein [Vibrio cholerae]|nr:Uncharacterised protein [Vibrio cholerae]
MKISTGWNAFVKFAVSTISTILRCATHVDIADPARQRFY